jgi:hypothetical protein
VIVSALQDEVVPPALCWLLAQAVQIPFDVGPPLEKIYPAEQEVTVSAIQVAVPPELYWLAAQAVQIPFDVGPPLENPKPTLQEVIVSPTHISALFTQDAHVNTPAFFTQL